MLCCPQGTIPGQNDWHASRSYLAIFTYFINWNKEIAFWSKMTFDRY